MALRPPPKPRPQPKPLRVVLEEHAPWRAAPYELADATAIKALFAGTANADQQKRGMTWIVRTVSGYHDEAFRPGGIEGERETIYALGKQFVGRQVVKLVNADLTNLRRSDGTKPEPRESGE